MANKQDFARKLGAFIGSTAGTGIYVSSYSCGGHRCSLYTDTPVKLIAAHHSEACASAVKALSSRFKVSDISAPRGYNPAPIDVFPWPNTRCTTRCFDLSDSFRAAAAGLLTADVFDSEIEYIKASDYYQTMLRSEFFNMVCGGIDDSLKSFSPQFLELSRPYENAFRMQLGSITPSGRINRDISRNEYNPLKHYEYSAFTVALCQRFPALFTPVWAFSDVPVVSDLDFIQSFKLYLMLLPMVRHSTTSE